MALVAPIAHTPREFLKQARTVAADLKILGRTSILRTGASVGS